MAKKGEATLLLRVKSVGKEVMDRLVITTGDLVNAAKAAGNAMLSFGKAIFDASLQASQFDEVKTAFTNLAAKQGEDSEEMLANMRDLSKGTINDLELMKQANNALLLGLPVERFGDMLNIARSSAKATGQSMEFMLSSIVTGLGRGSKLILDNLGIVIDTNKAYEEYARTLGKTASELTDAEKKQGFINKALEIGAENAKAAGSGTLSMTDQVAKLKANLDNLKISVGKVFGPVFQELLQRLNITLGEFSRSLTETDLQKLNFQLSELQAQRTILNALAQESIGIEKELQQRRLDQNQAAIDEVLFALESEDRKVEAKRIALAEQDRLNKEAAAKAAEDAEVQKEVDQIQKEDQIETEKAHRALLADEQFAAQIENINKDITNEKNRAKQLKGIEDKKKAFKDQQAKIDELRGTKLFKFKQWLNSTELKEKQQFFSQIASLSSANNKALAAIGKAAAIANITINTARSISLAFATFPWPFSIGVAALMGVVGAVQAAKVAGVNLQEGGIVPARAGGTRAVIGEGGQDEAVIPLDDADEGAFGAQITLNVFGGMLGTEDEAREFALVIDEQLFRLRQNNESLAFDEDII